MWREIPGYPLLSVETNDITGIDNCSVVHIKVIMGILKFESEPLSQHTAVKDSSFLSVCTLSIPDQFQQ